MKNEDSTLSVKETFTRLREKLGNIGQDELAEILKKKLKRDNFTERTVRNYESDKYDKPGVVLRSDTKQVIDAARQLLNEAVKPDDQKDRQDDLSEEMNNIKLSVAEIKDRLLKTIETQAETIQSLSKTLGERLSQ